MRITRLKIALLITFLGLCLPFFGMRHFYPFFRYAMFTLPPSKTKGDLLALTCKTELNGSHTRLLASDIGVSENHLRIWLQKATDSSSKKKLCMSVHDALRKNNISCVSIGIEKYNEIKPTIVYELTFP